jgi:hypothetical protein
MIKFFITLLLPMSIIAQGSLTENVSFDSATSYSGGVNTFRSDVDNNNATIVGNAREGTGAVRFTKDAGGSRSEIVINGNNRYYQWDQDYWVGYSMKVVEQVSGFGIVSQHHARPSGGVGSAGNNAFSITTVDADTFRFYTSTDPAQVNDNPGSTAALGNSPVGTQVTIQNDSQYVLGEWNDIVLNFRLSENNTGYYRIWHNGFLIYEIVNSPTAYLFDADGTLKDREDYQKLGIYYGSAGTGIVDFDAFRVWKGAGGTYEDVSPLGLSLPTIISQNNNRYRMRIGTNVFPFFYLGSIKIYN